MATFPSLMLTKNLYFRKLWMYFSLDWCRAISRREVMDFEAPVARYCSTIGKTWRGLKRIIQRARGAKNNLLNHLISNLILISKLVSKLHQNGYAKTVVFFSGFFEALLNGLRKTQSSCYLIKVSDLLGWCAAAIFLNLNSLTRFSEDFIFCCSAFSCFQNAWRD